MRSNQRRPGPGWVPNQHGAWAMLIAPVLVGAWPRPTWWHLLLLATAILAFLALYSVGLWLKSGRKARYLPAARTYTAAAGVAVTLLVWGHPRLLGWAPVFAVGLGLSLWASARRDDRSWWNDIVLVLLGCTATLVSAGLRAPVTGGHPVLVAEPGLLTWPPPGASDADAVAAAVVLLAYFLGTVVHVKALIRERRDPRVRAASVGYHAVCAIAAVVVAAVVGPAAAWPLVVVALVAAARSWFLPYRKPGATPKAIGLVEVGLTVAVSIAAIVLGGALVG